MASLSDEKFRALETLGFIGSVPDMEVAYLKSLGATGNALKDLWKSYLNGLGYLGSVTDMQFEWLFDIGCVGSLTDRWMIYWSAQGAELLAGPADWAELTTIENDPVNDGIGVNGTQQAAAGFQIQYFRSRDNLGEVDQIAANDAVRWGVNGVIHQPERTNEVARSIHIAAGTEKTFTLCTPTSLGVDGPIDAPIKGLTSPTAYVRPNAGTDVAALSRNTAVLATAAADQYVAWSLCASDDALGGVTIVAMRVENPTTGDYFTWFVDFAAREVYATDSSGTDFTELRTYWEEDYIRGYKRVVLCFALDSAYAGATYDPVIYYKSARDTNLHGDFGATDDFLWFCEQFEICAYNEIYATPMLATNATTATRPGDRLKWPHAGSHVNAYGSRPVIDFADDTTTPIIVRGSYAIRVTPLVDSQYWGGWRPFGVAPVGLTGICGADAQDEDLGTPTENYADSWRCRLLSNDSDPNQSAPTDAWGTGLKAANRDMPPNPDVAVVLRSKYGQRFLEKPYWVVCRFDNEGNRGGVGGFIEFWANGLLIERVEGFVSWGFGLGGDTTLPNNWEGPGNGQNTGVVTGSTLHPEFVMGAPTNQASMQTEPFCELEQWSWWQLPYTEQQARNISLFGPDGLIPELEASMVSGGDNLVDDEGNELVG